MHISAGCMTPYIISGNSWESIDMDISGIAGGDSLFGFWEDAVAGLVYSERFRITSVPKPKTNIVLTVVFIVWDHHRSRSCQSSVPNCDFLTRKVVARIPHGIG